MPANSRQESTLDYAGLTCIVSGGQTGADQAGLRAAKRVGLTTAGYCPLGYLTAVGPAPWLGTEFDLIETDSPDYIVRTELNVMVSDGTVIFGQRSIGSNRTEELCRQYEKPCLWLRDFQQKNQCQLFRLWITRNKIKVLNVAGNRESRTPGIGEAVERFMVRVFNKCKELPTPTIGRDTTTVPQIHTSQR